MSLLIDRSRCSGTWVLGAAIVLSLTLLIWACAKPRGSRSTDADPTSPTTPKPRSPGSPAAPRKAVKAMDPCREAIAQGKATRVGADGRPMQAADPSTPRLWWGTARAGFTGRKLTGAEIWYLAQPTGGCAEVFVDGKLRGRISMRTFPKRRAHRRPRPAAGKVVLRRVARFDVDVHTDRPHGRGKPKSQGRFFEARRVKLKHGPHKLEMRAVGNGTVRLFGVVLERDRRGLVLDNLGVPGAQVANAAPGHKPLIKAQIARLKPDLVIVQLGTNDAYDRSNTPKAFERRLKRLLDTVRPRKPKADCLLVGAPDFSSRRWRKARRLRKRAKRLRKIQRKVAAAQGCVFWDWYAAMGGAGSMKRLMRAQPKLAWRDRVHLTTRGYRAFGGLLFEELMRSYAAYLKKRPRLKLKAPQPSAEDARKAKERRKDWPAGMGPVRFEDPGSKGLNRFFAKLALLQRWSKHARARVVYVGDSHIASDQMPGELRGRLQRVFGDAGHGYVHAGKPWASFRRRQLRHGTHGDWKHYFILSWNKPEQPRDRLYGAGGVSTWVTLPLPPPPATP